MQGAVISISAREQSCRSDLSDQCFGASAAPCVCYGVLADLFVFHHFISASTVSGGTSDVTYSVMAVLFVTFASNVICSQCVCKRFYSRSLKGLL